MPELSAFDRAFSLGVVAKLGGTTSEEDDVRAKLAEMADPEKFAREVLGALPLSRQQQRFLLEVVELGPGAWILLGGNGTGKTGVIGFAALFAFGPLACAAGPDGKPVGCTVLITAPKSTSAKATIYSQLTRFGGVASERGLPLPGWLPRPRDGYRGASYVDVNWHADGKLWEMRILSAAPRAGGGIAHGASGSHAPGQQIIIEEEGEGVQEGMHIAIGGLSVASNVHVWASTNPTSSFSPLASRVAAAPDTWRKLSFPAWEHPNVIERHDVIPGAVSVRALEDALRAASFERRGLAVEVDLEPAKLDFVYALAERGAPSERGPRSDGIPGHPAALPQVFRPTSGLAAGLWAGNWLREDESRLLFHVNTIRTAMASGAWRLPEGPPDRVGVDCAQSRAPVACPSWGPTARDAHDAKAGAGTIHLGPCREIAYGAGTQIEQGKRGAAHLIELYGLSPLFVLDDAFGGYVDSALVARGCETNAVKFGAPPTSDPTRELGRMQNRRAEMNANAALVLNSGIAVLSHSAKLLEQMAAVGPLIPPGEARGGSILRPKKDIQIPMDELDALVLSLAAAGGRPREWFIGGASPAAGRPAVLPNRIEDL